MADRKISKLKFTSLHSHSTYSVFDGLGYPDEHIDSAYNRGLNGYALTDHGNMNGFSHAFIKSKKMAAEGKTDFKVIYGIEAYVHPSVEQWQIDCDKIKEDAKAAKDVDEDVGLVVEDEKETKKGIRSILNKRSHLVLVAQNQIGLNNLFKMVTKSYKGNNFYRFPRMDYDLLKQHNEGIIASSACLGGVLSNDYWDNIESGRPAVYKAMEKSVEKLINIFGDRFYGELQWANYAEQHIVNQFIIDLSKQYGFNLISTCDSHYPSPDKWKDREIYKLLGWLGKKKEDISASSIPSNLEEMEYQLYPKSGDELFEHYRKFSAQQGFTYDDDLIADSIERTFQISNERISNYIPDTSIKLPSFVVPEGETEDSALAKIAVEAIRAKGLHKNKEYVDRLKEEIYTIKDRGFSKYFLTMKNITDRAKVEHICGAGRGSGAGSLVSYLLNITEIDPIQYNLQFSRFIRKASPVGQIIENEEIGTRKISQIVKIKTGGKEFLVSPDTSIKVIREGKEVFIPAKLLKIDDLLVSF
jgi:DNA polymerase-3 subunit alpha